MESSSSEDDFVVLGLLEKRKRKYWVLPILKTRGGRVSPADKGAAELSRSLPGVFQDDSIPV